MKKTRIFPKLMAFAMGVTLLLPVAGCAGGGETAKIDPDDVDIWAASNTQKIFQDSEYGEEDRAPAGISLSAFKNESESAQLVFTPEVDVPSYDVELSDLKSGSNVLSAENVSVYNQKYIFVAEPTTAGYPVGYYPDALLPFETAKEYGENCITKGENQSVWFDYHIPATQAAGTYTGTYKVSFGGTNVEVPVSVTVYDYTLKDEIHSRSLFGMHIYWNEGGIAAGEKDSSWEMFGKYYDYLLDYRICGRNLPAAAGDVETFIEQLKIYGKDWRVTNITLPYTEKYDSRYGETGIDYDEFKEYLVAIYQLSMQENYNYFAKISTYFTMFDEASTPAQISMANNILANCYEIQEDLADQWRADANDAAVKDEVISSMLNMVQLFVSYYQSSFTTGGTYCPILGQYNTEESRNKYQHIYEYAEGTENYHTQNTEKWWYNAGATKNPYASYNMDTELYSPRIYSWMQYAYDVTGNLYWSTTFYVKKLYSGNFYETLQDYYSDPLRFPPYNGDGFLLYPGAPYGIDGPVGSIRLTAVRDGLEEYDLLYDLESYYLGLQSEEGIAADFDGVMSSVYNTLFDGTKVAASNESFAKARASLAQMLVAAEKTGALVISAEEKTGAVTFEIYVPDGVTLEGGTLLEETENGSIYTVTVKLDQDENSLACTLTKDGKSYALSVWLGGKKIVHEADETLKDAFSASGEGSSVSLVSDGVPSYEGSLLKAELAAAESYQRLNLDLTAVSGAENSKLEIWLYNPGDACSVTVKIGNNKNIFTEHGTLTLNAGWNTVSVDLASVNLAANESLKTLRLEFGEPSLSKTFYISNITIGG